MSYNSLSVIKYETEKTATLKPPVLSNGSRTALENELSKLNVNPTLLVSLTSQQLSDLLFGLNKVTSVQTNGADQVSHSLKMNGPTRSLSFIDRTILKALLNSRGQASSPQLSKELDIPLTTIQRRRNRLEEFIEESYTLRYGKFGKRQVIFIVSLGPSHKSGIADDILYLRNITAVRRIFGDGVDLLVEAVLESNKEIMSISENIRSISGVQHVRWLESLEVMGRNKELDVSIIEEGKEDNFEND